MSSYSMFIQYGGEYNHVKKLIENGHRYIRNIWHSRDPEDAWAIENAPHVTIRSGGYPTIYQFKVPDFPFEAYDIDRSDLSEDGVIWVEIWDES